MISLGNTMTLPEFERLLEIYGSDRTRWPVEARASAGQLTARDPAACRLLLEAEALDRILERAPLPSLASEAALAERIVAAAQRSPRMVRTGEAVANATSEGAVRAPLRRPAALAQRQSGGPGGRFVGRLSDAGYFPGRLGRAAASHSGLGGVHRHCHRQQQLDASARPVR